MRTHHAIHDRAHGFSYGCNRRLSCWLMAPVAMRPTAASLEREASRLPSQAAKKKKALPVSSEIRGEDDPSVQDTVKDMIGARAEELQLYQIHLFGTESKLQHNSLHAKRRSGTSCQSIRSRKSNDSLKLTPCTSNRNHRTLIKNPIAILRQTFLSQTRL